MKKAFVTVDVECHDINLENNYIWGKVGNEEFGIRRILELGKKHDIPINFFFDMCEANRYGEDYARRIIDTIRSYGQPVYLHLHPNYISGDDSRTFLWQYSYEEQRDILEKAFKQYCKLMETDSCSAFRVGRYGASEDMYKALSELNVAVNDLSYCYGNRKMCKLTYAEVGTINLPTKYYGQIVFPNTQFICFDYFGKQKFINTDLQEVGFNELKDVLSKDIPSDLVFTIHSWNFINRYFFKDGISGNKKQIKKFEKVINYCKKKGFIFGDVGKEDFSNRLKDETTEEKVINNCKGFKGKIKSLFYNFFRFQQMAKINKKYFKVYGLFYFSCAVILAGIALLVLL